jgi:hypothetical protein
MSRSSFTPLSKVWANTQPIFTKVMLAQQVFVKKKKTLTPEHHESPANSLSDTTSQTDRQTDRRTWSPRKAFFCFLLRKERPGCWGYRHWHSVNTEFCANMSTRSSDKMESVHARTHRMMISLAYVYSLRLESRLNVCATTPKQILNITRSTDFVTRARSEISQK